MIKGESITLGIITGNKKKLMSELIDKISFLQSVTKDLPLTIFVINKKELIYLSDNSHFKKLGMGSISSNRKSLHQFLHSFQFILGNGVNINGEELVNRVLSGETISSTFKKNGFEFKTQLTPLHNSKGEISEILGMMVETSKLSMAKKYAQDNFRILSKVNDAIIIVDEKMRVTYWNDAAKKIYGWSFKETKGQIIQELLQADFISTTREHVLKHLGNSGVWKGELIQKRKDGTEIHVFSSVTFLYDEQKSFTGAITINHDITDKKKNEEILKISEAKFSSIFHASLVSIAISNFSNLKMLDVNNAWEKITGYKKKEVIGLTINALSIWNNLDDLDNIIMTVMKNGTAEEYELKIRNKAGNFVDLLLSAARIQIQNQAYLLTMAIDITERKKIAEILRTVSAHFLRAKEEEKIYLARELHDNIGQSLTGLKMDLAWILKKLNKSDDVNLKMMFAEKIKSTMESTDTIIQNIREISSELRPNILDTLGLIPAIEWQLEELKKRTNINYHFTDNTTKIELAPLRTIGIYRIIQESITNIIRHSEATFVECEISEYDGKLFIILKDNGIGFPKSKISDLNSLGLLGMKERAMLLEGKLTINSESGRGTQITLTIPMETSKSD